MMTMAFIFFWWQEGGMPVAKGGEYKSRVYPVILGVGEDKFLIKWFESKKGGGGRMFKIIMYDDDGEVVVGGDTGFELTSLVSLETSGGTGFDMDYGSGKIAFIYEDDRLPGWDDEIYFKVIDTLFNEVVSEKVLAGDSLNPRHPRVAVGDDGVYVCWDENVFEDNATSRLMKLDFEGNVVWEKEVGTDSTREGTSEVKAIDGGGCLIMYNISYPTDSITEVKLRIERYDGGGLEIWSKEFDYKSLKERSILIDAGDSGYIYFYRKLEGDGYKYCAGKIGLDGEIEWEGVEIPGDIWDYSDVGDNGVYVWYYIEGKDGFYINIISLDGEKVLGDSGVYIEVPYLSGGFRGEVWREDGLIGNKYGHKVLSNGIIFYNSRVWVDSLSPVLLMNRVMVDGREMGYKELKDGGAGRLWGMEVADGAIFAWNSEGGNTIWLGRIDTLGNWAGVKEEGKGDMLYDRVMFVRDRYVLRGEGYKDVKVYNILGEVVKERRGYGDMEVIDRNMSDGVYMIKIREDNKERIEKIIKIKGGCYDGDFSYWYIDKRCG